MWLCELHYCLKFLPEIALLSLSCHITDLEKQNDDGNLGQSCTNLTVSGESNGEGHINQGSTLPPLCDLDMGVIESLPPDLLSEINDLYGGMLISLMSKQKCKSADIGSLWPTSSGNGGGKF